MSRRLNSTGFTIIELMIALSVMASILTISSVVLISLATTFTKGTNQANTQNVTRNIVNELAQQIEQSDATITQVTTGSPDVGAFCLGSQRYNYQLNHQLNRSSTDHVLWRDTMTNSSSCAAIATFWTATTPSDSVTKAGSGSEMMLPKMRLTDFAINPDSTGTYTIKVTVIYGDDDLVVTHSDGSKGCAGTQGFQYCAVSSLTQTVARRISN